MPGMMDIASKVAEKYAGSQAGAGKGAQSKGQKLLGGLKKRAGAALKDISASRKRSMQKSE